jgi:hypothetical protein
MTLNIAFNFSSTENGSDHMAQVLNPEARGHRLSAEMAATTPSEGGHQLVRVLGPADGTTFFLLGDRTAVFSEPAQQIYALNHTAAYIWCRLEEQASPATICGELARLGIGPDLAGEHVRAAVRNWLKLGLLKIDYNVDPAFFVEHSLELNIAGFEVTISVSNERLAGLLTVFEHFPAPVRDAAQVLQVIELDGLVHVFHNNHSVICCDDTELAPLIKAYITEQIVLQSPPNFVFHAACMVRDGKSLLISGRPGAGKTTLALRLTEGKFEYGGDDIALVTPDGSAIGVPFAPAVKSGAWEIVRQFRPDLGDAIIHRRTDAKRVRYLSPAHVARPGPHPVGWIIFIRRTPGPAKLEPLGPVETMRRLMGGSCSPDEKLSLAGCRAINRTLAGAGSYELTYSNLADANDIIERLCNG